jgi:hypothetical protein
MSNVTLSLVQTFARNFSSQIPDAEKDNVFRKFEFRGKFKLFPSTPEAKAELNRIQSEEGLGGLLEKVLVEATPITPSDMKFTDADGAEMTVTEFVKQHIIVQQDAVMAFWEVVNKGAEEKNLKKSRGR